MHACMCVRVHVCTCARNLNVKSSVSFWVLNNEWIVVMNIYIELLNFNRGCRYSSEKCKKKHYIIVTCGKERYATRYLSYFLRLLTTSQFTFSKIEVSSKNMEQNIWTYIEHYFQKICQMQLHNLNMKSNLNNIIMSIKNGISPCLHFHTSAFFPFTVPHIHRYISQPKHLHMYLHLHFLMCKP